jgi:hypothetical protein
MVGQPRSTASVSRDVAGTVPGERLPVADAEVALMAVTETGQALNGFRELIARGKHDVEVDDGLGSEAGNRRAPHVFDGAHDVSEMAHQYLAKGLELERPFGRVLFDDYEVGLSLRHLLVLDRSEL